MKLITLQNIILPNRKICTEDELYFRTIDKNSSLAYYYEIEHKLIFQKYAQTTFDTYFNSFSLNKWLYYTKLSSLYLRLRLKGKFVIQIISSVLHDGEAVSSLIWLKEINEKDENLIEIPINNTKNDCICFKLEALEEDSEFYGGEWCTLIEKDELQPSKIALIICTYNREEYLKQNVTLIKEKMLHSSDTSLKEDLYIYIVDNGRNLDTQKYTSPNIRVIPNINAGGSGGFARGMMEAHTDRKKYSFTHILLMDDDVKVEPESITRTINFLKLIKPEFEDAFLGGSMMRMDKPSVIHESGAFFETKGYHPLKSNLDVKRWSNVLFNEIPETLNYFAWWYCVIPISIITEQNLPLPLFIRLDDVEYGLRNMKHGITLNGISIWHEPFERRHTPALEYYFVRNFMIVGAARNTIKHPFVVINMLSRKFIVSLLHYNYDECNNMFNAIDDYYKGLDWLTAQDPEQLHKRVSSKIDTPQDVRQLGFEFNLLQYFESLHFRDSGLKRLFRRLTFNGYFLPTSGNSIVTNDVTQSRKKIGNMYRAKKVMQYDITSNRGVIFTRSVFKAFFIIVRFILISIKLIFTLHIKNKEYQKKIPYLKTLFFWKDFLKLNE